MATRSKSKPPVPKGPVNPAKEIGLLELTRNGMQLYGIHVNQERALPDFRDGLKPVHRKVLWALSQGAPGQYVKTARVVGDVLGKYHPHGDASTSAAIETLVNCPIAPIDGRGNWGSVIDGAAAMRYTNLKMSDYGQTFFGKHYLAVTRLVPNYDDREKEPAVLPALLPNLFLNGTNGIGVGTKSTIPSYTLSSIAKIVSRILKNEDIPVKDYLDLEFNFEWGGRLVKSPANRTALLNFYKTGRGSFQITCDFKFDAATRTIDWRDFAPGVNPLKVQPKVLLIPGVERFNNTTDKNGTSFEIQLRRNLSDAATKVILGKIKKLVTTQMSCSCNVTERRVTKDDKVEVRLFSSTVPELLRKWTVWRVKLEARALAERLERVVEDIDYNKLMQLAIKNLDVIFKALKTSDSAGYLVKHLGITSEQAEQILDRKVRSLSKLSDEKLKEEGAALEAHRQEIVEWQKNPAKKVNTDMLAMVAKIESSKS